MQCAAGIAFAILCCPFSFNSMTSEIECYGVNSSLLWFNPVVSEMVILLVEVLCA